MGIFSKKSVDKNGEYFAQTNTLNEYLSRQLVSEVIDKRVLRDAERRVDTLSNKYLNDDSINWPKSNLLQAKATISMLHANPDEAIEICDLAIDMDGKKTMPGIYRLKGMAYVWKEDFESARDSLKIAKSENDKLKKLVADMEKQGVFAELGFESSDEDEEDFESALIEHWSEIVDRAIEAGM